MQMVPGLVVRRHSAVPQPHELGAADVLTAVGTGAVLAAAINLLPDFLGSRRAGVSVRVRAGEKEIEVKAHDAETAVRLLEKIVSG
jgi:Effector Associated Constant Component 1